MGRALFANRAKVGDSLEINKGRKLSKDSLYRLLSIAAIAGGCCIRERLPGGGAGLPERPKKSEHGSTQSPRHLWTLVLGCSFVQETAASRLMQEIMNVFGLCFSMYKESVLEGLISVPLWVIEAIIPI